MYIRTHILEHRSGVSDLFVKLSIGNEIEIWIAFVLIVRPKEAPVVKYFATSVLHFVEGRKGHVPTIQPTATLVELDFFIRENRR